MSDETAGDRVRAVRKALGLTQDELAARAGIRRDTVVKVESGANQASTAAIRGGLARAFGLTLDEIGHLVEGRMSAADAVRRGSSRGEDVEPAPVIPLRPAGVRAVTERDDAVEETLTRAMDPGRGHLLRDARAVQEAIAGLDFRANPDAVSLYSARLWLDAAVVLRRRGEAVTAGALLVAVSARATSSSAAAWDDEARAASEASERPQK
jgi:transcriptional regulator with XRE-family HTH domain